MFGGTQWPFALKAFRKVEVRPSGGCYLSHRSLWQADGTHIANIIIFPYICPAWLARHHFFGAMYPLGDLMVGVGGRVNILDVT